uniref:Secreted protein n=2 Tax=Zooxanthella nutricula TaxID=1333877 RepID=A0A7S2JPP7_9DINO
MERLGTVGLLFIVVSLLLRCCAAGCHCMSGVYGVELYTLLEEGHYGDSDLSDLDDDDVSSDSSDNDSPCNSLPIIDEITPLHDQVQH